MSNVIKEMKRILEQDPKQQQAPNNQQIQQPQIQQPQLVTPPIDPSSQTPVGFDPNMFSAIQQGQQAIGIPQDPNVARQILGNTITLKKCYMAVNKLKTLTSKFELNRDKQTMLDLKTKAEDLDNIIKTVADNPDVYKPQLGEITQTIKLATKELLNDFLTRVRKDKEHTTAEK